MCPISSHETSVYLIAHHGTTIPMYPRCSRPFAASGDYEQQPTKRRARLVQDVARPTRHGSVAAHESRNRGAENAPDAFIANVDDGETVQDQTDGGEDGASRSLTPHRVSEAYPPPHQSN